MTFQVRDSIDEEVDFRMKRQSAFDLETCARSNILKLKPYRCARE